MGFSNGITKPHNFRQPFALDEEPLKFDATDEDLMHDLLGNDRLGKPVAALMHTLWEIEATETIGWRDMAKAFEQLKSDVKKFRAALKEQFEVEQ